MTDTPAPFTSQVTTPRIVIFNGPPGSGKSTVVEAIVTGYSQAVHCQFAAPLKAAAACLLCISILELEAQKDEPLAELEAVMKDTPYTIRHFLIDLSEQFVKRTLGEAAFGKIATRSIKRFNAQRPAQWLYLFSDGGFEAEIAPLIEAFGPENILIIRLSRTGCTFKNDSRNYVSMKGYTPAVTIEKLKNNGTVQDLISNAGKLIEAWIVATIGTTETTANGTESEAPSS